MAGKIAVDCVSDLKAGEYMVFWGLTVLVNNIDAYAMCCFGVNLRGGIAGWKRSNFDGGRLPECVSYLPQDFGYYPNYTAVEFLMYIAALKGIPKNVAKNVTELLEVVDLSHVANKK